MIVHKVMQTIDEKHFPFSVIPKNYPYTTAFIKKIILYLFWLSTSGEAVTEMYKGRQN
jgi:hypothetical protein